MSVQVLSMLREQPFQPSTHPRESEMTLLYVVPAPLMMLCSYNTIPNLSIKTSSLPLVGPGAILSLFFFFFFSIGVHYFHHICISHCPSVVLLPSPQLTFQLPRRALSVFKLGDIIHLALSIGTQYGVITLSTPSIPGEPKPNQTSRQTIVHYTPLYARSRSKSRIGST